MSTYHPGISVCSSSGGAPPSSQNHTPLFSAFSVLMSRGLERAFEMPDKWEKEKDEVTEFLRTLFSKIEQWNTITEKRKLLLDVSNALCAKYSSVNDFDNGMFHAFKQACVTVEQSLPNNYVPLWLNDEGNWAICLARQLVTNEYAVGPEIKGTAIGHTIVLVEETDNGWKTRYCTAVIEFKMLEESLILPDEEGIMDLYDMKGEGPSYQAISCIWTHVWPSLRRMGRKDISRMPFLVIACEKKDDGTGKDELKNTDEQGEEETNDAFQSEKKGNNNARYIRGDLIAPPTCGDVFTYSVNSYMPADNKAANVAVSCEYFEVVSKGFDICHEHMVEKREGKVTCLPLGGCKLPEKIDFLDKDEHDLKLVASPVYSTPDFRSSQGDIWTAQMSKEDFESIQEKDVYLNKDGVAFSLSEQFIRAEKVTGTVPVVVKVSSTVIVSPLISPSDC